MGLSFLSPLFFAGAALLIAPYLIHQIRRPDRDPVRFSSTLFIPNIPQEVIERKRIQHWLLMVLRMLVLLLLAVAFTRPYWRVMAEGEGDGPVRHLVLIDRSYSMGAAGAFEAAKEAARDLVREIGASEPVGVMAFADTSEVLAPLSREGDPNAGTPASAIQAIDAVEPTALATRYIPALQAAQRQLLTDSDGAPRPGERYIVHLVSDLQRSGLPKGHGGWKLSPAIELDVVPVSATVEPNYAVTDIHVRQAPEGGVRVLGKVRNWSENDAAAIRVALNVDGREVDAKTMSVKARSASQTSFTLNTDDEPIVTGFLALARGGLPMDDRRYFAWSPPVKAEVVVAADAEREQRWPPEWFLRRALPDDPQLPWRTRFVAIEEAAETLENPATRPDAIVITANASLTPSAADAVRGYVASGGRALLTLDENADSETVNATLLAETDLRVRGPLHDEISPSRYSLLSWVDLDHSIFVPFQSTRFNDFSSLRFTNAIVLDAGEDGRILARLEDGTAVLGEAMVGDGRVVLWGFPLRLEWTNFPKSARFIPVLHETLAYLTGVDEQRVHWMVGERIPLPIVPFNEDGRGEVWLPGSDDSVNVDAQGYEAPRLLEPGILRMRAGLAREWPIVQAVNVDPDEGDPARFERESFILKVASAPVLAQGSDEPGVVGANVDKEGFVIHKEYGRWAITAVLVLLAVELVYMTILGRGGRPRPSPVSTGRAARGTSGADAEKR